MQVNDLQRLMDLRLFLQRRKDKKIIIFGTGDYGQRTHYALAAIGFSETYFVDNRAASIGKCLYGRPICAFLELLSENRNGLLVLIGIRERHYEVEQQLLRAGFRMNEHFLCMTDYLDSDLRYDCPQGDRVVHNPSYTQQELKELFCPNAFTQFHVQMETPSVCCSVYIKNIAFEHLTAEKLNYIWNSFDFQKVRQGVLDGSFSCCDEVLCPLLASRKLPKRSEVRNPYLREIIEKGYTKLHRGPKFINFAFDPTCNLRCKMCRNEFVLQSQDEDVLKVAAALRENVYEDTEYIVLNGVGEALFAKTSLDMLENILNEAHFPNLKGIEIQTNANLFDEKAWKILEPLCKKYKLFVAVSLDACREDTYDRIRIGGNFSRVLDNLTFISNLREAGMLEYLRYNFCVQRENFREFREFIDFAESHQVDLVWFQALRGVVDPGLCVHLPGNVYYEEFCEQIVNPCCKSNKVNIAQFRDYVEFPEEEDKYLSYDDFEYRTFNSWK